MYLYLCPCMLDLKIILREVIKNILFTKRLTKQHRTIYYKCKTEHKNKNINIFLKKKLFVRKDLPN